MLWHTPEHSGTATPSALLRIFVVILIYESIPFCMLNFEVLCKVMKYFSVLYSMLMMILPSIEIYKRFQIMVLDISEVV